MILKYVLYFSDDLKVLEAGWALQCPCFGIYTHNTVPASTGIIFLHFYFSYNLDVSGAGWALQCPCYGICTQNTVPASTITIFLNKLFISVIKRSIQGLVGHYSVYATAFIRTILSLPEPHQPPPSIPFPCSLFWISARCEAIAPWRPDTRDERLQVNPDTRQCRVALPVQPAACICIFLCTNSIGLQALRECHNAYRDPLAALYLPSPCLYCGVLGFPGR